MRKYLRFVLVVPIACAVVCAIVCLFLPNEYTATTSMYVLAQSSSSSSSSSVTNSDLSASQMLANDAATIAKSDTVANKVADSVGLGSLSGYDVEITSSTSTRLINLSVTGADPQMCANIANAYVDQVSSTVSSVMDVQSVNQVEVAQTPTSPSGPNRPLYIVVAFLVGLLVAVVIVVIRDAANTRARNDQDVIDLIGVPVVGHFPSVD